MLELSSCPVSVDQVGCACTNDTLNALLSYHEEMLVELVKTEGWSSLLHAMPTEVIDLNEFRSLATAVLCQCQRVEEGNVEEGNVEGKEEEGKRKEIVLRKRVELERRQRVLLSEMMLKVGMKMRMKEGSEMMEMVLSKEKFLSVIGEEGVLATSSIEEQTLYQVLSCVKRYEKVLRQCAIGRTVEENEDSSLLTVDDLVSFCGAMLQETMDEEGAIFGSESTKASDDDY